VVRAQAYQVLEQGFELWQFRKRVQSKLLLCYKQKPTKPHCQYG